MSRDTIPSNVSVLTVAPHELGEGPTVQSMLHSGIPISVSKPVPDCPVGLELLVGEKNFYFEEIQLTFLERDNDARFSYNLYLGNGSRIFFMANPSSTTAEPSMQFYRYEILQTHSSHPVMIFEGNQYGGIWDVCFACCVCTARRGIRVKHDFKEVGRFEPVDNQVMPCRLSWAHLCYCYIDQYWIQFHNPDASHPRNFATRKPTDNRKPRDIGLEVIDPTTGRRVAMITNCVLSGKKEEDQEDLPPELQNSILAGHGIKVRFALSLADEYVDMHPFGKSVLLALAIFHESELMHSHRKSCKDKVGFLSA